MAEGYSSWTPAPGGWGGAPPGGNGQMCQSSVPSQARPLDEVGRCGEEEDHLERAVEHGVQYAKLYHQSHIWCPTLPTSLVWRGSSLSPVSCPGTLKHILVGCKTSLTQGRNTWRHNQVLKCLAITLESKRVTVNAMPLEAQTTFRQPTSFVREGEKRSINRSSPDLCPVNPARDWEMRVDLNQRLTFPPEIAATNLRPDLVLWSKSRRHVFIVELTVPWEEAIDEAFERKISDMQIWLPKQRTGDGR